MAEPGVERKLAAIQAADVVGYGRHIEAAHGPDTADRHIELRA